MNSKDQTLAPVPWHYQAPWDPYAYRQKQRGRWKQELRSWLKRFGALCSISLFAYLAIALVIMLLMTSDITENLLTTSDTLFIITPIVTPILEISGAVLVLYYLFLAGTITIAYFFIVGKSLRKIAKEVLRAKPEKHSPLLIVGGLFFAILSFNLLYYIIIIEAGGVSPNVPPIGNQPFWRQIYIFAQASVWEEIITRVLLIGVPLLWLDLLFRRGKLLRPHRYFLGGSLNLGAVEIGLIIFSSFMFGFAHAGGWDLWKVPPTIIAGIAFGYLFVTVGFYAAVMFHFAFDFLRIPLNNADLLSLFVVELLTLVWLVAGIIFFVYYSLRLKDFFISKKPIEKKVEHQFVQGPS